MAKTIDESIKAQGGSVGRMSYVRVIFALLARDLAVLRKTAAFFVIRVVDRKSVV